MTEKHLRLIREEKTIRVMIDIYCHDHHGTNGSLCPDCEVLMTYAQLRLTNCPFQEAKTTCANCPAHCYKPDIRTKIKDVMRYAGPRMTMKHPYLAVLHFADGFRKSKKGK